MAASIAGLSRRIQSTYLKSYFINADTMFNLRKLYNDEEQVILDRVFERVSWGLGARLAAVADMANSLRAEHNPSPVGLNWASMFVKRRPELQVEFNRRHDYK